MKDKILIKLKALEKEKNIEILLAVESGSRAWGFASPDSDYDIRFIYKHDMEHYLSLWDKNEAIEFMTSDDLDGSGWDIAKTLKLLSKSNAPLLEWLNSPIVYYKKNSFISEIEPLANVCFSPIGCLYHYLGTTKNFMHACEADYVKLKSYFYALRTALAGKWIIDKKSFPPVLFSELFVIAPLEIQEKINELIILKSKKEESYLHPKEELITEYLKELITYNSKNAKELMAGNKDNSAFDRLFIQLIKE